MKSSRHVSAEREADGEFGVRKGHEGDSCVWTGEGSGEKEEEFG